MKNLNSIIISAVLLGGLGYAAVAVAGMKDMDCMKGMMGTGKTAMQTMAAVGKVAAVGQETAKFTIDKMTCAACPITVSKAMKAVEGVVSVEIDFESKTATVIFDPAVTDIEKIGAASTDAGYPATPAKES